jgi:hypothetical protein
MRSDWEREISSAHGPGRQHGKGGAFLVNEARLPGQIGQTDPRGFTDGIRRVRWVLATFPIRQNKRICPLLLERCWSSPFLLNERIIADCCRFRTTLLEKSKLRLNYETQYKTEEEGLALFSSQHR